MIEAVVALILGGGVGTRLYPLTRERSKPAVPLGGKYRLVDVPISNCLNSGIRRIFVLTQFNSASLNNHISRTYRFDAFGRSFVNILAAEQTPARAAWFQGTADAVRQNLRHFSSVAAVDQYLILGGDQLYRMDFSYMVAEHLKRGAEITVAVTPVAAAETSRFGILQVEGNGRIVRFLEKPKRDQLEGLETEEGFLASMGIYLFNRDALEQTLLESHANDFGHGIIPESIEKRAVYAHIFQGYFEDVGTIRSFYEANLELTDPLPSFNLYEVLRPIYTRPRFLPASKVDDSRLVRTLLAEGCILDRCHVEHSVVGIRARIQENAVVKHSIVMGADFYQAPDELEQDARRGVPSVGIGAGAVIENAIVDKNARIGARARVINTKGVSELDGDNFVIRDGIVVVPKNVVIPEGAEI